MFNHRLVSAWDTKANCARVNFIYVQLELAATYCSFAEGADLAHLSRYLKIAWRTYQNVLRFMLRANLRGTEFSDVTANAERLKFRLDALEAEHNGT